MSQVLQTLRFMYQLTWAHLTLLPLLIGPCVLVLGHKINSRLPSTKLLDWSPFHLRASVVLLPMGTRAWPLWTIFLAAVMLPCAVLEELIFRYPIHNLWTGIWLGGIAFGFAHLTSLVSLRACLYLVVIGWVFVVVYELLGFWAVVLTHASYNLAALSYDASGRLRSIFFAVQSRGGEACLPR